MDMTIKATNEINTFVTEYNDELQKLQGIYKVQSASKLLPVFKDIPSPCLHTTITFPFSSSSISSSLHLRSRH